MRIAVIGQAAFGKDVLDALVEKIFSDKLKEKQHSI